MKVEREDLNPCTIKLTVTCTPSQVKTGVNRAIKALSKRIRVPGFRPGTAPKAMIEKLISAEEVKAMAQEETVQATFKKAVKEEGIELTSQAKIESIEFDQDGQNCSYVVIVPLPPKVELGEYKGLKADKFKVVVTDDEIGRQVDELRTRGGKKTQVDRGIEPGDNALVNIKSDADDAEGRNFMVVAGQTFEDLDKAIVGMKVDDLKSVTLNFPDNFQEADMAGLELKCTVTVRSVSAIEMPELDDEFAKSLNIENVGELTERIRENIKVAKENMAQELVNERLFEQIQASSTVIVADTTWQNVVERRLAEIKAELEQQKSNLEEYAKQNGMTEDEFVQAQEDEAKTQVERAVIIEKIFKDEEMQVTKQDSDKQFLKIAWENKIPQEGLKKFAKEHGADINDEIVYRTMFAKVMALLNESAEITEIDPPEAPVQQAGSPINDGPGEEQST